jgi:hypothetical protein
MAEIFGKKPFRNAITDDIPTINASIASTTEALNTATANLKQAENGIYLCGGKAWGCVDKSGRHLSTWEEQLKVNQVLVYKYTKELEGLLILQNEITKTQGTTAVTVTATAAANRAIAEAETAISNEETSRTISKGLKYGLIIGGVLILVIGGIIAYKKFKK